MTSVAAANVLHGDLKADNVAMMHDGNIKIMDFGNSRIYDIELAAEQGWRYSNSCGMPPEMVLVLGKSDLYAAAMVVVRLLFSNSSNLIMSAPGIQQLHTVLRIILIPSQERRLKI